MDPAVWWKFTSRFQAAPTRNAMMRDALTPRFDAEVSSPQIRYRAKDWLFRCAAAAGVTKALLRRQSKDSILVLCYHGVVADPHVGEFLYRNTVSAREFSAQIEFLSRYFTFISARDLTLAALRGTPLPERPVLITFDDGYRNNVTCAAPVLRKYNVPAMFSVVTGLIGTENVLWTQEVDLCVLNWPDEGIPLPVLGRGYKHVPLPHEQEARIQMAQRIRQICKEMPLEDLEPYRQLLKARIQHKDVCRRSYEELLAFMTWDQVRNLAAQGFEIASHTVNHPILSRISPARLCRELRESKKRIESELGIACPWLVYPNGQVADYSDEVFRRAREEGYDLGFAVRGKYWRLGADPFEITRIRAVGHQPMFRFEARISGVERYLVQRPRVPMKPTIQ